MIHSLTEQNGVFLPKPDPKSLHLYLARPNINIFKKLDYLIGHMNVSYWSRPFFGHKIKLGMNVTQFFKSDLTDWYHSISRPTQSIFLKLCMLLDHHYEKNRHDRILGNMFTIPIFYPTFGALGFSCSKDLLYRFFFEIFQANITMRYNHPNFGLKLKSRKL